jgi:RHS repeat-associated protein
MSKRIFRQITTIVGLLFTFGYSLCQQPTPTAYNSNVKLNYTRTWEAKVPQSNADSFTTATPIRTAGMSTQYIDGLYRPIQTVAKQSSKVTGDSARDMVSPITYDEFGREQYKYLPFAADTIEGNGSIRDGQFKLNPFQQQAAFMQKQYGSQGETFFYGVTTFEPSPLNRIEETFAPGNNWVGTVSQSNESNRHSIKLKYWANAIADSVRVWTVIDSVNKFGSYSTSSFYAAGQLSKNVTVDEHGKQIVEFKDKMGLIILKKVQLTAVADTGSGKGYKGWLCTYYIYDNLGNLRCVIQPEGVKALGASSWILTETILTEQCFRYEYDHRNRMIAKKVPGAGEVYMVFDSRDRLIMTQDANLRATDKWVVTKYDGLNRPIEIGLWVSNTAVTSHRTNAGESSTYPVTSSNYEQLIVTHYDDYDGIPDGWNADFDNSWTTYFNNSYNTAPQYAQQQIASKQTKGMVTWTKTKILGSDNSFLFAVTIYDDEGRVIQVKSTNALGTTISTTQYDWLGKPLITVQFEAKTGANAQTTVAIVKLSYDELDRLTKIERKISNTTINGGTMPSSWTVIAENEYDALGQLKKKTLGTDLERLAYDYNIRGWMLGMNRSFIKDSSNNYFGFELAYDKTPTVISGSSYATAQYNGNITGLIWKSTGDKEKRKYDFAYDAANRLLAADFNQYTSGSFNKTKEIDFSVKMGNGTDADSAYDYNGNILRMQQWGLKGFTSELIDDLSYTYTAGSNKLKNVVDLYNDTLTKLGDFRSSAAYITTLSGNKTSSATDYTYDENGNLKTDLNKDIISDTVDAIEYNYLNLPTKIRVKNKGAIEYIYDAKGTKLKKTVYEPGKDTTVTVYVGGSVYKNDTLQLVGHEEGRIRPQGDTVLVYDYFIKDNLGNIRMVLTSDAKDDTYSAGMEIASRTIEEQLFMQIPETEANKPAGFDSDAGNQKVSKVMGTATSDKRIGPGVVLKVMAGDKFRAGVKGWYQPDVTNPNTASELGNIVDQLVGAFAGGLPAGGNHGQGSGSVPGSTQLSGPLQDFVDNHNTTTGAVPKAYLNWIVLDEEQFKLVEGNYGAVPIPEITGAMEKQVMLANDGDDIEVKKNGYLYVYVSNASKGNVYFDELSVVHTRGPLLEETHYYPFGLTMTGISSQALKDKGCPLNKKGFNGIEHTTDLDLNQYDAFYRNFNPQIGRFFQIDPKIESAEAWSPYSAMLNNPIRYTDPLGDSTRPPKVIRVAVYESKWPNVYKNVLKGIALGKPLIVTYDSNKKAAEKRSRDAKRGHKPAKPGNHLDEYPPKCTKEGGAGAAITEMSANENQSQGGVLGFLVGAFNMETGDQFEYIPISKVKEEETKKAAEAQIRASTATQTQTSAVTQKQTSKSWFEKYMNQQQGVMMPPSPLTGPAGSPLDAEQAKPVLVGTGALIIVGTAIVVTEGAAIPFIFKLAY